MEKGKRIETVHGEFPLPEAIIQHIQSFLSGKEAARTSLLSKSWHTAWLTRPSIHFEYHTFNQESWCKFRDFASKTMQRYQDLGLKIECFNLASFSRRMEADNYRDFVNKLIVDAMKIGAKHVKLEFLSDYFTLPQEVLASQTLLTLSSRFCRVDGNYVIRWSNLKSLTLTNSGFTSVDVFDNIISRNTTSLEELSLTFLHCFSLSRMNLYELHKLRRLFLCRVDVGAVFSTGFASRFPCLNDLSIIKCRECEKIEIASTSLRTISFEPMSGSWKWRAKFDVPNIRKFIYSGSYSPSNHLTIKAAPSREWDFDVSISCNQLYKVSWFRNLKMYLSKFRLSRMSFSLKPLGSLKENWTGVSEHEIDDIEVADQPLVVENLMIDAIPTYCCALLVRLLGICRPKFVTHDWSSSNWGHKNVSLDILCKRLVTPGSGIPDQSMFGKFNLKQVNVEVYEMFDTEWQQPLQFDKPLVAIKTPVNERQVRFELIWG